MEMFDEYVPLLRVPVTDNVPPKSLTVVVPEYVLSAASTSVPVPVLVKLKAPETAPDIVPVLVSTTFTVELPVIATAPLNVPLEEKYTADDVGEYPTPVIDNGSAELRVSLPATSSVAPDCTIVRWSVLAEPPSAEFVVIFSVPCDTVVSPV